MGTEECASENDDLCDHAEKYLIFTTGSKTYTPHQIGFKRIKPVSFPRKLDPGPSLRERLAEREREKQNAALPRPEPNWLAYDEVADKFDKVDHLIDLHGHIIGMGLSPDHRYVDTSLIYKYKTSRILFCYVHKNVWSLLIRDFCITVAALLQ
jgi:F-box/WD-40 domain protein 5